MSSQPLPAPANQLFRYLFEQASLGIAVEDLEGKILLANPALCSMLGYTEQELHTMSCSQFANPEDSQDDWALFQQLRAGVIDHYSLEKRYIKKDGARIWGHLNASLLKGGDGGSPLVFAFVEEITERKLAEQELARSNERFRLAAKAGKMYAYDWDPRSDVVTRSEEYVSIFGLTDPAAQPTRQQIAATVHPDDRARFVGSVDHLTPENPTTQISYRLLRSDGAVAWLEKSGRAFFDKQGRLLRVMGMVADITERKRAEEALSRKDKELGEAQRLAGIGSWVWDARTDELTWSKEVDLRVGRDPGLPAPRLREQANLFTAESWDRLQRAVEKAVQAGTPYELDLEMVSPKSTVRWATTRGEPVRDAGGQIIGLRGTVQDITARKRAEEALHESEERFRLAAQAGKMFAYEWDAATDKIVRSEGVRQILGVDAGAHTTSQEILTMVPPEDRARLIAAIAQLSPEEPHLRISYRMVRSDGSVIWVERTSRAYFDEHSRMLRMVGMIADITERKRAEEALEKSEEKFSKAFRESPMSLTLTSAIDHRYLDVNETFEQMSGWHRDEVIGRTPFDIGIWADPNQRLEFAKRILAEGAIRGWEVQFRSKDGTLRVGLGAGELIQIGNELCILSVIADITERKLAEAALRETEDKLRLLLDSIAEAIYGIDLEHRCTFCNPACLRMLGYERVDDMLGKNMHDLIHHTRADGSLFPVEECRVHGVIQTGEGVHAEDEVFWRANGTSFHAEYWSHPQRSWQETVGAVVAFVDITERKLAEAALANVSRKLIEAQEQERMRIGRELHDDIGQRLALLAVELQQLRKHPLTLPRVRSRVGELQKQVSEIARDTQSLSHELHSAKLQYLGLAAAMRGFCREFGEQQKVEVDFKAHDLPSALSPDISLCLFRVLQEALHNSAKHSGVRHFEVRLWGTSDEIHLTVKDSGMGFDRQAAKESRGIGLISMGERLKLVKGTLSIESRLNRGTTIHARAPLGSASDSVRAAG